MQQNNINLNLTISELKNSLLLKEEEIKNTIKKSNMV